MVKKSSDKASWSRRFLRQATIHIRTELSSSRPDKRKEA